MKRQTYLLRKAGRYHFRRRFTFGVGNRHPITLSLGTADPVDARRIASRLAVRWDMITMYVADRIERGTLTIEEQRALFRRGLEEELTEATRHVTALHRPDIDEASYSKVAIAAYRIVASVPHDAPEIAPAQVEPYVDESWTPAERKLLTNICAFTSRR